MSRIVVITGASRGLGLASAVHLYRLGWTVIAAMRSVDDGLARLRADTGAGEGDPRLVAVPLDLLDPASITSAAAAILAIGVPDAVVHNAGISAAGCAEEVPLDVWHRLLATHLLGPVALTNALLPALRRAGRGRVVVVSSIVGQRGFPGTSAYSAAKSALERWAESLAAEIAPFGLAVTVLVTGTFDTEIITDAGTIDHRGFDGPYAPLNHSIDQRGRQAIRHAAPPQVFARQLADSLEDDAPFSRRPVGHDARGVLLALRLLPARALHHLVRRAMGLPRHGTLAATIPTRRPGAGADE